MEKTRAPSEQKAQALRVLLHGHSHMSTVISMMRTTRMAMMRNLTATSIPIRRCSIVTLTIRTFIIGTGISQTFFVDVNVYAHYRSQT